MRSVKIFYTTHAHCEKFCTLRMRKLCAVVENAPLARKLGKTKLYVESSLLPQQPLQHGCRPRRRKSSELV